MNLVTTAAVKCWQGIYNLLELYQITLNEKLHGEKQTALDSSFKSQPNNSLSWGESPVTLNQNRLVSRLLFRWKMMRW
jgi:hypothetical protein